MFFFDSKGGEILARILNPFRPHSVGDKIVPCNTASHTQTTTNWMGQKIETATNRLYY